MDPDFLFSQINRYRAGNEEDEAQHKLFKFLGDCMSKLVVSVDPDLHRSSTELQTDAITEGLQVRTRQIARVGVRFM